MFSDLLARLGSFLTLGRSVETGFAGPIAAASEPQFIPRCTPDFPPLLAVLSRDGEPYPVIVEGADVAHARRVLEGEMHREFENFLSASCPFEAVSWIALVRSLDGTAEGIALSWLVGRGPSTRMRCDRVRKRVMKGEGRIENVGLALLVAQLRWMKENGYWRSRGEVLTEYDPAVMASYRRTCGLTPGVFDELTIATSSVDRFSGEEFLRRCPFPIRRLF